MKRFTPLLLTLCLTLPAWSREPYRPAPRDPATIAIAPTEVPTAEELTKPGAFVAWVERCQDHGWAVELPPGVIDVPAGTWVQGASGLTIRGRGMSAWRLTRAKDDGDAIEPWGVKSWHTATTTLRIVGDSDDGLRLVNTKKLRLENLTIIRRDPGKPMLHLHTTSNGLVCDGVGFYGESVAVQCGQGPNQAMASDTAFHNCTFVGFHHGDVLRVNNLQSVNHRFVCCEMDHHETLIDLRSGGNVSLAFCSVNGAKRVLRVGKTGRYLRPQLVSIGTTYDNSGRDNTILVDGWTNDSSGGLACQFVAGKVNCHGKEAEPLVRVTKDNQPEIEFRGFTVNGQDCSIEPTPPEPDGGR